MLTPMEFHTPRVLYMVHHAPGHTTYGDKWGEWVISADEARDMIEYAIIDSPFEVKYYMCDSCGHVFSLVDYDGFLHTWEDLEDDLVDTI